MTGPASPWALWRRRLLRHAFALALLAVTPVGECVHAADAAEALEFFERRIRPLLIDHCHSCHGPDTKSPKGGLRLDQRDALLKGGESGPAIAPGQPDQSRLIRAVRYTAPDLQMPPDGKRLAPDQVADLERWVADGAVWTTNAPAARPAPGPDPRHHWAFQPVRRPAVPPVKQADRVRTPVDAFVLAGLEARSLSLSPEADRRTLIRRLSHDLTGLPPSPDDVDAFVSDPADDAYERLVERLLASPHYGERWGRHWLDVARFADTKGYVYGNREEARFIHSAAYRDWVVRALNQDLPYDRFLVLQLAADQIVDPAAGPEARRDLAAMGFLTLGRRFLGVVHDIIDDRIDVVMRGTQALTVGCARCHDHKYDPIPIQDYYSLYGVFAGSAENLTRLGGTGDDAFEQGLQSRQDKVRETMARKREEYSNRFRARSPDYLVAVLDVKKLPSEEFYEIRGPDDLNPAVVRQWEAYLLGTRSNAHPIFGPWHVLAALPADRFAADAAECLAAFATNSPAVNAPNPLVLAALREPTPRSMREVAERYGRVLADVHGRWQGLLRTTASTNGPVPAALSDPAAEALRQVLYAPTAPVQIPEVTAADLEWYLDEPARVELMKLQADVEKWILQHPQAPVHAILLQDKPTQKTPRVFVRGNPANRGEEVPRRFLTSLGADPPPPFIRGSGRLELARTIARRENPLTARVLVNRVWLHHFGAGLVTTPSDFGLRSEAPSHPELLDWLADEFMSRGWSLKALHRLLVLSSTYRQRSDPAPHDPILTLDPRNRLLGRANQRRLDYEGLRDSLLAVSGELDRTIGGPSVDQFRPPYDRRRSLYGFIDRQFLPGLLRVFDFANPDMHNPQRSDTTVPQQALFLMNSPFILERSRALAGRVAHLAETNAVMRIRTLYRLTYQRPPTPAQEAAGRAFIAALDPARHPSPAPAAPSAWHYGFGRVDETTGRVASFTPLPHFTGEAWQGGDAWPDAKLGWVRLTADGGHTGNDLEHAAIRRWIAPFAGRIRVSGSIEHTHKEGDGIRARLVSSRHGILGTWMVHHGRADVPNPECEVQPGDTLDFVVDLNQGLNNDDFIWRPELALDSAAGVPGPTSWNAHREFGGPVDPAAKPGPWDQYAQVLLLSNELQFID